MPHIEVKTTQTLSVEQKISLTEKLSAAFAECSNAHVAGNIQYVVEDGLFINFRGDYTTPSANVQVHPGPLTPVEDYEKIVKAFFPILIEALDTPADHIYITTSEIEYWGFDNQFLAPRLNK